MKSNYYLWQDVRSDIGSMFSGGKTRYICGSKYIIDKYYDEGSRRTDVYKLRVSKVYPKLISYEVIELRPYKLGIDGYENDSTIDPMGLVTPYDRERVVYIDEK